MTTSNEEIRTGRPVVFRRRLDRRGPLDGEGRRDVLPYASDNESGNLLAR